MSKAYLVLDDGRIFEGKSWGAVGKTFGEAVFQTGMTGYQETLTDPSYFKQVVVMTAPHIGNTGVTQPITSLQRSGLQVLSLETRRPLHQIGEVRDL